MGNIDNNITERIKYVSRLVDYSHWHVYEGASEGNGRSGAKLPIDNLEFIDPILDQDDGDVKRVFYLAGPRHYIGCNGVDCAKSESLNVGDTLQLVLEPDNKFDNNAIKVLNSNNVHIGYIPRYYCESIINLLHKGYHYNCNIYEFQKDNNCNECIKIQLYVNNKTLLTV